MEIKSPFLFVVLLVFLSATFNACKKDNDPTEQSSFTDYSKLPADVSAVAQWYDQQTATFKESEFARQNTIIWTRATKVDMPTAP